MRVLVTARHGRPRKAKPDGLAYWQRIAARRRRAVLRLVEDLQLCRDLGVDVPEALAALGALPVAVRHD
jgi:hypothetical protein